jgi:hypothetical protein
VSNKEDFFALFEQLKHILQPYAPYLQVKTDEAGNYDLNTPFSAKYHKELFFGAVQIKKNYVGYYLMPIYMFPTLLDNISDDLKKRKQGKSCFNFTSINDKVFAELADLTEKSFDKFRQEHLVFFTVTEHE